MVMGFPKTHTFKEFDFHDGSIEIVLNKISQNKKDKIPNDFTHVEHKETKDQTIYLWILTAALKCKGVSCTG